MSGQRRSASQEADTWRFRADVLRLLAAAAAVTSIVGAVVLIATTGKECRGTGPFEQCEQTHPLIALGVVVGLGGLSVAWVIFIVNKLCSAEADRA